jgi:hypothetical protein
MPARIYRCWSLLCFLLLSAFAAISCASAHQRDPVVVKPRYHNGWYKNHVYKKKWRIGRIILYREKQGVKKVKMKS